MKEKFEFPTVHRKNKVIFSKKWCKDAILVKVENGLNKLRFELVWNSYEVTLNGESLFSVNGEKACPTCGEGICRGYGERNLSMKEALEISGKINEKYQGTESIIENAVQKISPLLGLLADGYYVIADSELFPYVNGVHFWEDHGVPGLFSPSYGTWEYYERIFGPSYLIASERVAVCDIERVEYYIDRLEEEEEYPRAIGCYLGDDIVLLLDGHHKAAAQAAKGKMVKCLVIMPVSELNAVEDIKKEPLLHTEERCLLDGSGTRIGFVHGFFAHSYSSREIREDWEVPKSANFSDWGKLPREYKMNQKESKKAYEGIFLESGSYPVYPEYKSAKEDIQRECIWILQNKQVSKEILHRFLIRHHLQYYHLVTLKTSKVSPLLSSEQWHEIYQLACRYDMDKDSKTANLLYGIFSFYPGQSRIDKIPEELSYKLRNEKIEKVLIPNTVKKVNQNIFSLFPDLKKIIVEKGSPYFYPDAFKEEELKARQMRVKKEEHRRHLYYTPFADIQKFWDNK